MKRILLTIIIVLFYILIKAQSNKLELNQLGVFSPVENNQSKIYLNQDNLLKEITLSKISAEKEHNIWRIQIYLGSGKESRNSATATRNAFKTKFPEVNAELIYHSPYFKVQVGYFKSRIEAESFKRRIIGDYPKCWVVGETHKI